MNKSINKSIYIYIYKEGFPLRRNMNYYSETGELCHEAGRRRAAVRQASKFSISSGEIDSDSGALSL